MLSVTSSTTIVSTLTFHRPNHTTTHRLATPMTPCHHGHDPNTSSTQCSPNRSPNQPPNDANTATPNGHPVSSMSSPSPSVCRVSTSKHKCHRDRGSNTRTSETRSSCVTTRSVIARGRSAARRHASGRTANGRAHRTSKQPRVTPQSRRKASTGHWRCHTRKRLKMGENKLTVANENLIVHEGRLDICMVTNQNVNQKQNSIN